MFKNNKQNVKSFMMGALMMLVVSTTVVSVAAASKFMSIKVSMGGIKVYVDGKLAVPTDGNGKKVEPMIYDGTTYLPLRALSNVLSNNTKEVAWDSDTQSAYIGEVPVAASTDLSELKIYSGGANMRTGENAQFKILDKTRTPFNSMKARYDDFATYILDANYSEINGSYVIPFTSIGSTDKGKLEFYNVSKNGEETLIKEYSAAAADNPVPVKVNLRGVQILKIKFVGSYGAFYDASIAGR